MDKILNFQVTNKNKMYKIKSNLNKILIKAKNNQNYNKMIE